MEILRRKSKLEYLKDFFIPVKLVYKKITKYVQKRKSEVKKQFIKRSRYNMDLFSS